MISVAGRPKSLLWEGERGRPAMSSSGSSLSLISLICYLVVLCYRFYLFVYFFIYREVASIREGGSLQLIQADVNKLETGDFI